LINPTDSLSLSFSRYAHKRIYIKRLMTTTKKKKKNEEEKKML